MSTMVELQRAKEQKLAATREALDDALAEVGVLHQAAVRTHLFNSGILQDADEVRREGYRLGHTRGYDRGLAEGHGGSELRAAIVVLCEVERAKHPASTPWRAAVPTSKLRALLADDGVAVLREHDQKIRDRLVDLAEELCPHEPDSHPEGCCEVCDYASAISNLRDTAGEAGDE